MQSSLSPFTIHLGENTSWFTLFLLVSTNYGSRYSDNEYEYRHVQLPKNMLKKIPADYFDTSKGTLKLLWEDEWRGLGITQVFGHFGHEQKNSTLGYLITEIRA